MVRELRLYNPNKHVLIYHDPDSSAELDVNAQHARTKLDLGLGFTQEYETYIFSYGNFTLSGPADFTNVCWDGMVTQHGKRVTFEDRTNWSNQAIFKDTSRIVHLLPFIVIFKADDSPSPCWNSPASTTRTASPPAFQTCTPESQQPGRIPLSRLLRPQRYSLKRRGILRPTSAGTQQRPTAQRLCQCH